ncbi:MAG: substrate-binding periplasmic protein [Cellvibrionaceae bacterium]
MFSQFFRRAALLLLIPIACWGEAASLEPTLAVGHWPPYIDQSAPSEGILARRVLDIYQEAGIAPRLVFGSWTEVVEQHLKKPNHLSFGWVKNSERLKKWHYSDAIMETVVGLWVRTTFNQPVTDYTHLKPYLVGVSRYTSYGQEFEENKHIFRKAEFVKEGQGFSMLIDGRIDAFIGDPSIGEYYLSRHQDWQSKVYFLRTPIFSTTSLHMICEKSHPDCLKHIEQFNRALKRHKRIYSAVAN